MKPREPETQAAMQWVQMWQELFRMWMGYFAPFMPPVPGMPGVAPFMPGAQGMNAPFGHYPPARAASVLDIELRTSQRVSVSLHLTDPSSSSMLKAHLHSEEGAGRLALDLDPESIRIALPDDLAPGTYSGVVRDGAGRQCGMMTIVVFGPSRDRA